MKSLKRVLIVVTVIASLIGTNLLSMANEEYPNASDWAIAELSRAEADGFITDNINDDFRRNITREEFCEIAVILYDRLGGNQELEESNPFTDTTNPIVIKAYHAGIIEGVGNNLFAPEKNITRQELCVMIIRAMKQSGIVFGADSAYTFQKDYKDIDSVANWAYTQVRIMNDFKIMNGAGDYLLPLSPLTVEQAIIMLERAYLRDFTIEELTLIAYTGNSSEIKVPEGIEIIDDAVFYGNNFLTTIELPLSTRTIGYTAFKEMLNLETIILNEGLITIGEAAFELSPNFESIKLPSTLTTIEFMGFQDCESLGEINLPASLTTLGDQAFYSCESLGRVVFNNNTVAIGDSAFDECPNVVFVCESGSTAHNYALENDINVELK